MSWVTSTLTAMTEIVSVIGAVAAVVAAVRAGVAVWVNGRREERRWVGEALVETFIAYLQSSFLNEARAALEERQSVPTNHQVVAALWSACEDAHGAQMQALTRLRLLAPPSAVATAERLHTADHEVTRYAFGPTSPTQMIDGANSGPTSVDPGKQSSGLLARPLVLDALRPLNTNQVELSMSSSAERRGEAQPNPKAQNCNPLTTAGPVTAFDHAQRFSAVGLDRELMLDFQDIRAAPCCRVSWSASSPEGRWASDPSIRWGAPFVLEPTP